MDVESILKKFIVMVIISFAVIYILGLQKRQEQSIKTLDYDVELQANGDAIVTENWDIYIKNTNTLFKQFDRNYAKYRGIENVRVKDLDRNIEFEDIDKEMYHVTKDCFYGLDINLSKYEIAWGVGMDKTSGRRRFEIEYTIKDAINSYKDMQEFYWQFLGKGANSVPVKNVTGRIKFPNKVEEEGNLMAWGHGPLNGEVKLSNRDTVEFNIKNLSEGAMLEIRAITKDRMFEPNENKEKSNNQLDIALNEEKQWADEANNKRQETKNVYIFFGTIYLLILLNTIRKIYKVTKIRDKEIPKVQKLEYYRDIPRENKATPSEAIYIYKFNKERLETGKIQSRAVAATILNLCLKKCISLKTEGRKVFVKIGDENLAKKLDKNEVQIYNLLKQTGKGKEKFEIGELNVYAKNKYNKYSKAINNFVNETREKLYEEELIDKKEEKEYASYINADIKEKMLRNSYELSVVVYLMIALSSFNFQATKASAIYIGKLLLYMLPYVLLKLKLWKLQNGVLGNISVLTKKGMQEKEEWKGLKNFMENFSLLNEKKVPDLQLWEEYLVYATAFGISDKVIEQMKAAYPEVFVDERWDNKQKELYPIMNIAGTNYISGMNTFNRIDTISNSSYKEAMHQISLHSSSSGSGSGGGFSGGGGGRRWRRPEWEEDNLSDVKYK